MDEITPNNEVDAWQQYAASGKKGIAAATPDTTNNLIITRPRAPAAFDLKSEFKPAGDQPTAIAELIAGIEEGERDQVLLGVTGSGKTFTAAHVITAIKRPTLILAPNKTLAAQLYGEMKALFPDNAVEYFVSYYDYYQPEAYVPRSDTYIEKESSINEQIDRMRHSATRALLERDDVIIVASVSCIYGIGSVETYSTMTQTLAVGEDFPRQELLRKFTELQYRRNDTNFVRGAFRVRGDSVELFPATLRTEPGGSRCLATRSKHFRDRPADRRENPEARQHHHFCQFALRDTAPNIATGLQADQGRT